MFGGNDLTASMPTISSCVRNLMSIQVCRRKSRGRSDTAGIFSRRAVTSKFDKPALVIWSMKGPLGIDLPANQRHFDRLREAIQHVMCFPHGTRAKMTIRTRRKEYGPAEIEELAKEISQRA